MTPADWPAVRDIYAAGIATGDATFEATAPAWEQWDAGHLAGHRLVATVDDTVVGWAALSQVSDRCVDAGVAENSLYVHRDHRGHGIGPTLLDALVTRAERAGYWTIQTGIFPENTASIAAHKVVGFRIAGRRERPRAARRRVARRALPRATESPSLTRLLGGAQAPVMPLPD